MTLKQYFKNAVIGASVLGTIAFHQGCSSTRQISIPDKADVVIARTVTPEDQGTMAIQGAPDGVDPLMFDKVARAFVEAQASGADCSEKVREAQDRDGPDMVPSKEDIFINNYAQGHIGNNIGLFPDSGKTIVNGARLSGDDLASLIRKNLSSEEAKEIAKAGRKYSGGFGVYLSPQVSPEAFSEPSQEAKIAFAPRSKGVLLDAIVASLENSVREALGGEGYKVARSYTFHQGEGWFKQGHKPALEGFFYTKGETPGEIIPIIVQKGNGYHIFPVRINADQETYDQLEAITGKQFKDITPEDLSHVYKENGYVLRRVVEPLAWAGGAVLAVPYKEGVTEVFGGFLLAGLGLSQFDYEKVADLDRKVMFEDPMKTGADDPAEPLRYDVIDGPAMAYLVQDKGDNIVGAAFFRQTNRLDEGVIYSPDNVYVPIGNKRALGVLASALKTGAAVGLYHLLHNQYDESCPECEPKTPCGGQENHIPVGPTPGCPPGSCTPPVPHNPMGGQ